MIKKGKEMTMKIKMKKSIVVVYATFFVIFSVVVAEKNDDFINYI